MQNFVLILICIFGAAATCALILLTYGLFKKETSRQTPATVAAQYDPLKNVSEPVISFVKTFLENPYRFKVRRTSQDRHTINFKTIEDARVAYFTNTFDYTLHDLVTRMEFDYSMRRVWGDPWSRQIDTIWDERTWEAWEGDFSIQLLTRDMVLTVEEQQYLLDNIRPVLRQRFLRKEAYENRIERRQARERAELRKFLADKERERLTSVYRDGVIPCKECGMIGQHKMSCDSQYGGY